jgi:hypothetical protein
VPAAVMLPGIESIQSQTAINAKRGKQHRERGAWGVGSGAWSEER